jgi:FlaA1/EpsC-like NDP-sugar epimerase
MGRYLNKKNKFVKNVSRIGDLPNLQPGQIIIAVENNERELITDILRELSDKEVNIKITPDMVDIISGSVKTINIIGVPLIDIHSGQLPAWQQNIKRI